MVDALNSFLDTSGFMPHGHCFLWTPMLLWSYVVSDTVIAAAYYSIPIALWYFVRKRPDLPFRWIFVMFGVFVMACGTTHVFAVWNIWQPNYWVDAALKAFTAGVSIVTAILLWPLIPKALSIPSQAQLTRANRELQEEIARRQRVESELREINRALQERTTQLETANRELESFSYSVAHDLRGPLRHIDAFAKLMLNENSTLAPTHADYLGGISKSATRMGRLVDDLLAFSRTSRGEVREEPVDLNRVVEEVRHAYLSPGSGDGVDWRIGELPIVLGDASHLRVAFQNLLSNAVKFSAKRDHPVIEVGVQPGASDEVVVVVRDNGAGFDPRYKHKLFGVFQRLHREDEFEGTGIGLATVHRIVEKHGGRIAAEGEPGRGAAFYLTLRRA